MKLSFILEQSRSGELASLSKVDKTDERVIGYLNLALVALYNRFQLATEEAIVTLRPDIPKTVYTLGPSDPDVRVAGAAMPEDDFKAIVYVTDDGGREVQVNNEKDPYSIFTVSYNQIQVPLLSDQTFLSIVYRRNPRLVTFVDSGDGSATDTDVDLPIQLLEPALHYIGYRAHGAVDGNIQAENSTHYTRFLAACDAAEKLAVITADDTYCSSVQQRGWL